MKIKIFLIFLFILFYHTLVYSQELEKLLEEGQKDSITAQYALATFKSSRLINGHTIEAPGKNEMYSFVSHRFGLLSGGIKDLFGLDQSANIRIGVEYGLFDRLAIGIGRSRIEKLYDASFKFKLIKQQTDKKNIPFSMCLLGGVAINTEKAIELIDNFNQYRYNYTLQLLIASKLSGSVSLQVMPVFIHKNLVKTDGDKNNIYAIGGGGRIKLSKRVAISGEYYYVLPNQIYGGYESPLSFGVEIETGGHIFQFHISNSLGMIEKSFITQTEYSWNKGDVVFGFNICRFFSFNKSNIK